VKSSPIILPRQDGQKLRSGTDVVADDAEDDTCAPKTEAIHPKEKKIELIIRVNIDNDHDQTGPNPQGEPNARFSSRRTSGPAPGRMRARALARFARSQSITHYSYQFIGGRNSSGHDNL